MGVARRESLTTIHKRRAPSSYCHVLMQIDACKLDSLTFILKYEG